MNRILVITDSLLCCLHLTSGLRSETQNRSNINKRKTKNITLDFWPDFHLGFLYLLILFYVLSQHSSFSHTVSPSHPISVSFFSHFAVVVSSYNFLFKQQRWCTQIFYRFFSSAFFLCRWFVFILFCHFPTVFYPQKLSSVSSSTHYTTDLRSIYLYIYHPQFSISHTYTTYRKNEYGEEGKEKNLRSRTNNKIKCYNTVITDRMTVVFSMPFQFWRWNVK